MKSKIIFLALAMSMSSALVAHADSYQRPQRPQRPAPIQDDQYDEPEDEGLDEDYRRPSRDCNPCQVEQRPRRPEYYCQQPHCQPQPQPPHILPYPYPQPVLQPVPLPIRIMGPCTVMPNQWGWSIMVNGNYPLAHGSRQEAPNLIFLRQHYIRTGVCTVFLN